MLIKLKVYRVLNRLVYWVIRHILNDRQFTVMNLILGFRLVCSTARLIMSSFDDEELVQEKKLTSD